MARKSDFESELGYRNFEASEDSSDAFIMMLVLMGVVILGCAAYFNV